MQVVVPVQFALRPRCAASGRVPLGGNGGDPARDAAITYRELHGRVCRMANVLKELGVGLALEDFGQGSSLDEVREMPQTTVKLVPTFAAMAAGNDDDVDETTGGQRQPAVVPCIFDPATYYLKGEMQGSRSSGHASCRVRVL